MSLHNFKTTVPIPNNILFDNVVQTTDPDILQVVLAEVKLGKLGNHAYHHRRVHALITAIGILTFLKLHTSAESTIVPHCIAPQWVPLVNHS